MPLEPRTVTTPRFILGVCIVLMGIALILDQLGMVPAYHLMRFWPVVLILLGLASLQRCRGSRGAVSGLVLVIIGTWLLLNTLGLVFLRPWEFIWPLILVVIGARIMMRNGPRNSDYPPPPSGFVPPTSATLSGPAAPSAFATGPATGGGPAPGPAGGTAGGPASAPASGVPDHASLFSVMGSSRRRWGRTIFRTADTTSLMGGCELDLREALLGADGIAHVEIFALMGGVEIFVPPTWTVVTHVMPIMGGVEDKTHTVPSTTTQQLIIRGTVMMGGVVISN
jgi:predicted membrane protein